MQLFFNTDLVKDSTDITFSKEESRHIAKALRKKNGDILCITNGKGWLFEAVIISNDIKRCIAKINKAEYHKPKDYYLHLAVAPTKMNDRYEWFLEKATEIGIHEITPILCDNSERKILKKERFEKIIQSAMKQSLQYHLPKLNDAISFKKFLDTNKDDLRFIAHCEDSERKSLKSQIKPKQKITVLIGPEGDFSTTEIKTALDYNYSPVILGHNRLRTETAAIVVSHCVALANQL
ncbi:16S rRNA (uracil(1498)-N(3))-methyltransferase [Ichthyenterobacterium sp. W332]|uniref:Ribosomal RNA small subunit methyltransferase E n=1 Tax=Microcosmobacter mediterraneus TaxID=3075607 RepID=A0ABU2YMB8_9FLAO|nr:16S rRNA (uracil(1498)-N(3))-methyltransferase [Ichthyenterobacterium sp. W332]MDT0559182.1 16S rRNA (uracil(1498)-N(3))-methyltransferase [Ichthyenterobacterium sp. W332]